MGDCGLLLDIYTNQGGPDESIFTALFSAIELFTGFNPSYPCIQCSMQIINEMPNNVRMISVRDDEREYQYYNCPQPPATYISAV